jgi:hypothetical protein
VKNAKLVSAALVLMAPVITTCDGDEDDDANCPAFLPCGGNVVGSWEFKEFCLELLQDPTGGECPTATFSTSGVQTSGTVTYNADMTGTTNTAISGTITVNIPSSCLGGMTCGQVNADIQQAIRPGGDLAELYMAASCTGGNLCICSLVLRSTMMMAGGPWSTSGNILSQGNDPMEYCVQGNDLFIRTPMSMGVMGEASVSARLTRR